ncbi:hypothetical protein CKO28_16460 [Rhodovibrio sodomensis]|uniref:Uncharacterized protein n=1 Tax=Rhodovibrio sodomensis TaxID=1088 RepID=A0ABS1DHQ4_9PROT|nr:hypothetical protein [Rhodovibrio sodomensis]
MSGCADRLLAQFAGEALQAEAECVNAPSEAEQDAAHDRHAAIVERMPETPADTLRGVAAKVRAVRNSRPPHEEEQLCERLEHRALVELERVAGEGA